MKAVRTVMSVCGAAGAALVIQAAVPAAASPAAAHAPGLAVSVASIFQANDVVTGVRGTGNGTVVLTGSGPGGGGHAGPLLYQGSLAGATGAAVPVLKPRLPGVTAGTFYGPDTHFFDPGTIPAGEVRAVGSYQSSAAPDGVRNLGMIYRGPVSGRGGSWASIAVPANGAHTVGHVRACPRRGHGCFVMDTIAHSTMGDLVVGNYDLSPGVRGGAVSGHAFIYNMASRRWTLLRLGGKSSETTVYGIWHDGGPRYTLAGGSSARGRQRGLLLDYNERTGTFGRPWYFSYRNAPTLLTHFEGITAVPGGFAVAAQSTPGGASMAFIPAGDHGRRFGTARWTLVSAGVQDSGLCPGGCRVVTGNTVFKNRVMGLYVPAGSSTGHSYLATVPPR